MAPLASRAAAVRPMLISTRTIRGESRMPGVVCISMAKSELADTSTRENANPRSGTMSRIADGKAAGETVSVSDRPLEALVIVTVVMVVVGGVTDLCPL